MHIGSVTSHLGAVLKPGDLALGYPLHAMSAAAAAGDQDGGWGDEAAAAQLHKSSSSAAPLPDVMLVRKKYRVGKHQRARRRSWRLRSLAHDEADAALPSKAQVRSPSHARTHARTHARAHARTRARTQK
jgi:hypothetical protein